MKLVTLYHQWLSPKAQLCHFELKINPFGVTSTNWALRRNILSPNTRIQPVLNNRLTATFAPQTTHYFPLKPPLKTHLWQKLRQKKLHKARTQRELTLCVLSLWPKGKRTGSQCPTKGPKRKAKQVRASPIMFYRKGGQTPNSTLKY